MKEKSKLLSFVWTGIAFEMAFGQAYLFLLPWTYLDWCFDLPHSKRMERCHAWFDMPRSNYQFGKL